jgi:hypothetical protein
VKETGLFPVFEAEHGEVVGVSKIRRQVPVEEYLKPQRRYAHLFGDPPRADVIARIQERADRNIKRFGLLAGEGEGAELPGAATDAAGSGGPRAPHADETSAATILHESHERAV